MNFDLEKYKLTRQTVIDSIKASHKWETTEGFIADGLISPETYAKEDFKIICFLGESYGYDECGLVDIESQLVKNILGVGHYRRHTSTKVPVLLWLIYESISRKEKIKWDDFPSLLKSNEKNTEILQKAISKTAWINVKKASKHINSWGNDATRQSYDEIYKHSRKNEEILRLQIESTRPDLMIVCSDPVFHSLSDMKLLGEGIKRNKKYKIQRNELGQMIIHVSHPSYHRDWGYEGIYEIFQIIYGEIENYTHNNVQK